MPSNSNNSDESLLERRRSRRRRKRRFRSLPTWRMNTIYEDHDDDVEFQSRNSQRWGVILLLSMVVFFGLEGFDLTEARGRRQDTPHEVTEWTVEQLDLDSTKKEKRKSWFRPPKRATPKSLLWLEGFHGDEDLVNEFDSISPIKVATSGTNDASNGKVTTIDLLEDVVTKEQQQDLILTLDALVPPLESKAFLGRRWLVYRSFSDEVENSAMAVQQVKTIPTFWHIPKTGGSTIKAILGNCHFKIMASEEGVLDGHEADEKIDVVHIPGQIEHSRHVNVDVTTEPGLQRAATLGLVPEGVVDVIATPLLWEAAQLFDSKTAQGKVFSLFRHPIARAVSMFAYLQEAKHERTYQEHVSNWTLDDYATSTLVEDNFMVRQLCHTPPSKVLKRKHLERAKAIVCQKILVGLLDHLEESLERFERFFGWSYTANPTHQETCRNSLLANGVNMNTSPKNALPSKGSIAYDALVDRNKFDLELYEFVENLYHRQSAYVQSVPVDIRLVNATCTMCQDGSSLRGRR